MPKRRWKICARIWLPNERVSVMPLVETNRDGKKSGGYGHLGFCCAPAHNGHLCHRLWYDLRASLTRGAVTRGKKGFRMAR